MRRNKLEAALRGTILFAETCDRLRLPFKVEGFQDVVIPVKPLSPSLTAADRRAIADMPLEVLEPSAARHGRPMYNDDGPCVEAAARDLVAAGAATPVLIVISDGHPEGKHRTPQDLHDALSRLEAAAPHLTICALGLGENTRHVEDYYRFAKGNIPTQSLASEIAQLVRRATWRS